MTVRTWLYGLLTDDGLEELRGLIGDRVFAKKSMKSSIEEHPYIVYKLGNDTSENLSETSTARRQFFQIYVHDYADTQTADYIIIDRILEELKEALQNASSGEDRVIEVQWLETSQDLNDETLGTVFKYARFVAVVGS